MRPGFTKALDSVLRHADEEARKLGQEFVGAEHLLLGVMTAPGAGARKILESEVDLQALRRILGMKLPKSANPPVVTGRLPLSPKAQRLINDAIADAQASGETVISSRFLLLAVSADRAGSVAQILSDSGADLDELTQLLRKTPGEVEG